jgi:hypothetical protein
MDLFARGPRPGPRPPRARPALAVEPLEGRRLPALAFHYFLDDPGREFDAHPGLLAALEAAGQLLSQRLEGEGRVEVRVFPTTAVARAGGSTVAVTLAAHKDGLDVYEGGALTEARTGLDPNGDAPDLAIGLNARDYLGQVWFDPSGVERAAPPPADKIDFVSVALHETLHGLGFQGYREGLGGEAFPHRLRSTFDALSGPAPGADPAVLYFLGPQAAAAYGGPVPLTSAGHDPGGAEQNWYHLGNPAGGPGDDLVADLMNGVAFAAGRRYEVSRLDLAVLADLGWKLATPAVQFRDAAYFATEADGAAEVAVLRGGRVDVASTVRFTTEDGTGRAGVDYTPTFATLRFEPGQTLATVRVPLRNTPEQGDRTVRLLIGEASEGTEVGPRERATLTVFDAVQASTLQFTADRYQVAEDGGGAAVTVRRAGSARGAVAVNYAAAGEGAAAGSDFGAVAGQLTWASGDAGDRTVFVPVYRDLAADPDEAVRLTLTDPTGGALLGSPATARVVIADVPAPAPPAAPAALAGDVTAAFRVRLGRARSQPASRRYRLAVTLENVGGRPVQGPLAVVLERYEAARQGRARRAAVTRRVAVINVSGLNPGEAFTTSVDLGRAAGRPKRLVPRVLAGDEELRKLLR